MLNVAIIDDEKTDAAELKALVKKILANEGEEASFEYFDQGINFISDYYPRYDVIFMDVNMANMNGIDAAKKLRERDEETALIFVTHSPQYAIRGYEVGALDFLIKPFGYGAVSAALKRALKAIKKREKAGNSPLVLKVGSQFIRYDLKDVHYIEVYGHDLVYQFEKESVTTKGQLCDLEEGLKEHGFYRCFHSYIVNLKEIAKIEPTKLILRSGKELPLSRRKREALLKAVLKEAF